MYLHKIHLNLKCKEARRDVADPYEMHSTLCRAFSEPEVKCSSGGSLLWRLESERNSAGMPVVIIQSYAIPEWSRINPKEWFWEQPSPPISIDKKVIPHIKIGHRFRYRLRANPSVKKNGKRFGLYDADAQIAWLQRQGEKCGFKVLTIHRGDEKIIIGQKRNERPINIFSVLYDGILDVTDISLFKMTVDTGIGHGKAMGLGLLSVAPLRRCVDVKN